MARNGSAAFGAWLKERLGRRTYGQLATYVGVSTSTVSRWVTGESAPEYRNRLGIAAYLGVDADQVHGFFPDGQPAPRPAVMATAGDETGTVDAEDDAALLATADALFFGLVGDLRDMPARARVNTLTVLREIARRDASGGRGAGDRERAGGAG